MNIYDIIVKDIKNEDVSLRKYEGKIILIVNAVIGYCVIIVLVIKSLIKSGGLMLLQNIKTRKNNLCGVWSYLATRWL